MSHLIEIYQSIQISRKYTSVLHRIINMIEMTIIPPKEAKTKLYCVDELISHNDML